jgi:hypothetical protein
MTEVSAKSQYPPDCSLVLTRLPYFKPDLQKQANGSRTLQPHLKDGPPQKHATTLLYTYLIRVCLSSEQPVACKRLPIGESIRAQLSVCANSQ